MNVKIKLIEGGKLPEYKTKGSAGADCYARQNEKIVIEPGDSATIPLGFAVEIPEKLEKREYNSSLGKYNVNFSLKMDILQLMLGIWPTTV